MRSFCGIGWNVRNAEQKENGKAPRLGYESTKKRELRKESNLEMETGDNGELLHRQLLG